MGCDPDAVDDSVCRSLVDSVPLGISSSDDMLEYNDSITVAV